MSVLCRLLRIILVITWILAVVIGKKEIILCPRTFLNPDPWAPVHKNANKVISYTQNNKLEQFRILTLPLSDFWGWYEAQHTEVSSVPRTGWVSVPLSQPSPWIVCDREAKKKAALVTCSPWAVVIDYRVNCVIMLDEFHFVSTQWLRRNPKYYNYWSENHSVIEFICLFWITLNKYLQKQVTCYKWQLNFLNGRSSGYSAVFFRGRHSPV